MGKHLKPIDFVPVNSLLMFQYQTTQGEYKDKKIVQYTKAIYLCKCGKTKELVVNLVKRGFVKSCGCFGSKKSSELMTTHGLSKHPLFFVWVDMNTRCNNPNCTAYKWYGGRGVYICEEWQDFKCFYDWAINNGWKKGLRLDKDSIPKRLGIPALCYGPDTCCFLTHKENCNSRKSNHPITFNGVTKNMTQWEKDLGYPKDLIYSRLKRKWSIEKTLTTPLLR